MALNPTQQTFNKLNIAIVGKSPWYKKNKTPSEKSHQPAVDYFPVSAHPVIFYSVQVCKVSFGPLSAKSVSKVQKYSSKRCQTKQCPFLTTAPLGNIYLTFLYNSFTKRIPKGKQGQVETDFNVTQRVHYAFIVLTSICVPGWWRKKEKKQWVVTPWTLVLPTICALIWYFSQNMTLWNLLSTCWL